MWSTLDAIGWLVVLATCFKLFGDGARHRDRVAKPTASADASAVHAVSSAERDLVELRRRNLLIPVEGIGPKQLVPSFTMARAGHAHEALDILAPRGTPVLAVENGTIEKLFTSKYGGLTIYQFDPSRRYAYYYAHLDGYADKVRQGLKVKRGDVLGHVGFTGNASPEQPHLHFAIFKLGPGKRWWAGEAIDPYPVLTDPLPVITRTAL